VNVILPALEKRYDLSSSKSAIIASANDFGAFVLLIVVGYFGERRHKPKLMGIGVLVMALGCLLFSLPQFVGGKYAYTISGIVLLMLHNLDYAEIIFRWLENISSFY
jgi:MFS family permease